jgi:hypothetical protein
MLTRFSPMHPLYFLDLRGPISPKTQKKKFQFCFVAEVIMITHKRTLARFGFILEMKVGKKKTQNPFIFLATTQNPSLYFWLPTGTYHQHHLVNLDFFFFPFKILQIFKPFFFSLKIICI